MLDYLREEADEFSLLFGTGKPITTHLLKVMINNARANHKKKKKITNHEKLH